MYIFYHLILLFMKYTISIVPLWNFDSSTIDLLSSYQLYEYTIYSGTCGTYSLNLKKTITKNTDGTISEKNILTINSDTLTNWKDIHSIYGFRGSLYICPTGNNHLNK